MMKQFQIRKDDLSTCRVVDATSSDPAIGDGQIRVAIREFALTANNITYAVTGDRLGYWQFFPACGDDTDGWGVMPVWGFAEVIDSAVEGIDAGERLYGFFPPFSELTMMPIDVSRMQLTDGNAHRRPLPAVYNNYRRVTAESGYDGAMDNERMLLFPLLTTSFCLWDALQDRNWSGARQIIIVSASSKTAIGLSCALKNDPSSPPVVGLTSPGNLDFVNGLGTYQHVISYKDLSRIATDLPTAIVDMSGNSDVLGRLHALLGDNMKWCLNVGITHWDQTGGNQQINAERSEMFFAPSHVARRLSEWGRAVFHDKTSAFMLDTALQSRDWMNIIKVAGLSGVQEIYPEVFYGRITPDQGLIVELEPS